MANNIAQYNVTNYPHPSRVTMAQQEIWDKYNREFQWYNYVIGLDSNTPGYSGTPGFVGADIVAPAGRCVLIMARYNHEYLVGQGVVPAHKPITTAPALKCRWDKRRAIMAGLLQNAITIAPAPLIAAPPAPVQAAHASQQQALAVQNQNQDQPQRRIVLRWHNSVYVTPQPAWAAPPQSPRQVIPTGTGQHNKRLQDEAQDESEEDEPPRKQQRRTQKAGSTPAPAYQAPSQPPPVVVDAPPRPLAAVADAPPQPSVVAVDAPPQLPAPVYQAPPQPSVVAVDAPPQLPAPVYQAPPQPSVIAVDAPPQLPAPVYQAPPQPSVVAVDAMDFIRFAWAFWLLTRP